jgi:hypothetical protein
MPPEVAKALKESGRWQEGAGGQPVDGTPVTATPTAAGVNP